MRCARVRFCIWRYCWPFMFFYSDRNLFLPHQSLPFLAARKRKVIFAPLGPESTLKAFAIHELRIREVELWPPETGRTRMKRQRKQKKMASQKSVLCSIWICQIQSPFWDARCSSARFFLVSVLCTTQKKRSPRESQFRGLLLSTLRELTTPVIIQSQ